MSEQDPTLNKFTDSQTEDEDREIAPPTELTGVPDDWVAVRLDDVTVDDEGAFVDGPFGSNLKADEMVEEGYARIIQLQNIRASEFIDTNHKYVSKEKFKQLERHGAKPGDLAIAKMSEPVARACLLPEIEDQYLVVADCIKLTVDKSGHNSVFVMLAMNSELVWKQAFARSRGSTRKRINLTQLKEVQIPSPSLEEQHKIASVLYTVDQAIQKTEEIIRQTEQTQKGIIRRLFRRGISNEATETHEVLGEIPMSWQVAELSDIAEVVMGSSPKSKYYNESGNGLPFYQGNNDFNRRNPKTNVWCTEPVKQAKKGDILISIRAPVGDLNVATEDCCIGRGLAAIRPQSIDFDYLYYHLYERNNWFTRISSGSTFDSINSSQLKNLKIKLPPESTQEKIGTVLKDNEDRTMRNEDYLNHLRHLKQGLMQDLLSGEIRTDDKDIELVENVLKHG